MNLSRAKSVVMASLILSAMWTGACRARRSPEDVARELVETAEELAAAFESARTVEDLVTHEERLRRIVRRAPRLRTEARRAGELPPTTSGLYQARWDQAVRRIVEVRASWIENGKTDMLDFVDGLR